MKWVPGPTNFGYFIFYMDVLSYAHIKRFFIEEKKEIRQPHFDRDRTAWGSRLRWSERLKGVDMRSDRFLF